MRRNMFAIKVLLFVALCCVQLLRAELNNPTAEMLWSNARRPYPFIWETSFTLTSPRLMAVRMIRVDISNPMVHFVTNRRAEGWGETMPDFSLAKIRTRRQTVTNFLTQCRAPEADGGRGLPVVLAVNASPWRPWQAPFNHKYADDMGCMISEGVLVCPANGRWCFCVPKEGKPFLRKIEPLDDVSEIELALPGFDRILADGEITVGDAPKDLHPRTAFGLSADKRWFFILVVDGRQNDYSIGADCYELAQLLKLAGASDGINMDGGGSSTLVIVDPKTGKPVMLNRPTKDGKYQRPVANALGIYSIQ